MMMRLFVNGLVMLGVMLSLPASAEVNDQKWQSMQRDFFPGKSLLQGDFIKIAAPRRAESGAQVPFSFVVDYPMTESQYVKAVTVIVDANPVPLAAVFHFNPHSGKAEIATRIRLETDSLVHVVAETSDGKLHVNAVPVRASGGCGGTVEGDEDEAKRNAGKMRLALDSEAGEGDVRNVKLQIKHPMFTGLQRDLVSQGFRPAFYISKIDVRYNGEPVLQADTYIGISEDPNIRFPFIAKQDGTLTVTIHDNEDNEFSQSLAVKL
ncbi:quinoprotein dehydrogenase-associated SoxYZ-like carrier [Methylobacillus arboreus]|uniref:quinoprotein dehydrogenase-associated SoxYZ-like carrier n=1 Tax=Methylobacillus arboreus TaxID=755170 RepID=UPI001E44DCF9|nr:quinoprotein dehydrogenase-associated SoxYZ-like carrier [Methylobacillus arboreus]MCB5190790.1 quinoprotein dehydrogenase-associated SoxYZ-like carrier [Methylobacillus arboreus]